MTLEDLSRLETMHAEVHPAAPAEIYQWFPEMAKALREALARCDTLRGLADEKAYEAGLYARRMGEAQESLRMMRAAAANFEQAWKEAVAERDATLSELRVTKAFHDVAVKERDYERLQVDRLRVALKVAAESVCFAQGACGCAVCVARKALQESP